VIKNDDSDLSLRDSDRPAFNFKNRPELPSLRQAEAVEWNSSAKALAEFFDALGVADPATTARSLLREFPTLSDLLSASWWRLRRVVGKRLARTVMASHELMKAMLEEQVIEGPVVPRSDALIDFLQAEVGFLKHERLLALYVDSKCRLMRIERIAEGSFTGAVPNQRAIIGCALAIGAAGFILVHNHPSGIPVPSIADLSLTQRLKHVAAEFDLNLLDHLIVARGRLGTIEEHWREARFRGEVT
jgi:DNA repair protein RadC